MENFELQDSEMAERCCLGPIIQREHKEPHASWNYGGSEIGNFQGSIYSAKRRM